MKIKKLNGGHINDTYLLNLNNKKLILQKVNKSFGKKPDIKKITKFLEGKFKTSRLIEDWRVIDYIDGSSISVDKANKKQIISAIKLLAKFHKILQGFRSAKERKDIHTRKMIPQMADKYEKLKKLNLPKRVIHGDMWFENFLFVGEEAKAIIDLDTVHINYITWDLANLIFYLSGGTNNKFDYGMVEFVKKIYLSNSDLLLNKEIEAINYTISLFALEIHFRFNDYNYFKKLNKSYCDMRSKYAINYYENFNNRFF